ncbi:thioredoxin [Oscillospiraceae bacterium MB08-C2-2]|nr:thioredoxin [Oscillospiraceae bacterium MB08-C2-2]
MLIHLDENTFNDAINSDTPILVDFWAGWCMPCKMLAPVLDDLAQELDGTVDIGKVDIDQCPALATQYEVASIPTLILFSQGKILSTLVGVRPKDQIKEALENALSPLV